MSSGGLQCCTFDVTGAFVVTGGADGAVFVCQVGGSTSHIQPAPKDAPLSLPATTPEAEVAKPDSADEPHVIDEIRAKAQAQAQLLSQPLKDAARKRIEGLRERFRACLEENENAPELERLSAEDLIVDVRLRSTMDETGRQRVQRIQSEIQREIKVQEVVHHRIKAMVWDAMEVHGQVLAGLQTHITVRNFPIPKEGKEDRLGNRAALLRQVEMQEEAYMGQETGDERYRTTK